MNRLLARLTGLVVVVAAFGCGHGRQDPLDAGLPKRDVASVGQRLIDSFAKSSGIVFAECRDVGCLEQAAASGCRPSHLAVSLYGYEGAPEFHDYFVLPGVAGCHVIAIDDHSEDYWGGCVVRKRMCPTVATARSGNQSARCGPGEVLHQPRACPNPLESVGPLVVAAMVLFMLGGLACIVNVYLSFLRYPLQRLRQGPAAKVQFISGIPLFGSLAVAGSLLALHDRPWALAVGIPLCVLDTGGIHWFAGVMIWQRWSKP